MSKLTLSGSPNGNGVVTLSAPNAYVNRTMYLPDASTELVGTDAPQTLTNKTLIMPNAPLDYYTTAGKIEYDGSSLYGTPAVNGRGVLLNPMVFRLASGLAGVNATGLQSIFGVGVPVQPSTAYWFELFFVLQKSAGIVSHAISVQFGSGMSAVSTFLAGGTTFSTASLNAMDSATASFMSTNPNASVAISAATTVAAFTRGASLRGTFLTPSLAGNEFRPQYSLSAAPGGAYTALAGSYALISPIGPAGSGNVNIGNWA